jgi:SAM-dependent methyltransferase
MESDHPGRHELASNIEVIGELPPDHEGYDVSDAELISALSLAESKHFWHLSRNEFITRRLRKAGAEPGSTFLELGCGGGVVAAALAAEGYEVTGVDGHLPRVAEAAQRAPQSRFIVKDLRLGLDGLGTGFDSVGLFDVIEHLDDPMDVLRSATALLRPGGLLVGTVPALMSLWSEVDVVSGHRLRYDLRSMRDLLSQVPGIDTIEVKYFNRMLVAPMWVVRRKTTEGDTKDTIVRQLTPPRPWVNATALAAFRAEHLSGPVLDAARIPGSSLWFATRFSS